MAGVTQKFAIVFHALRDFIRGMSAAKAPASLRRLFDEIGTVDHVGMEERVAKYGTRSLKKQSKVFGLRMAVSMVDLTTLEGKDTPGKVASLCQKALTPHDEGDIRVSLRSPPP